MRTSPAINRGLEAYGLSRWNGLLSISGLSQRPDLTEIIVSKRQNRRRSTLEAIADGEQTPADQGQDHDNGRGHRNAQACKSSWIRAKIRSKSNCNKHLTSSYLRSIDSATLPRTPLRKLSQTLPKCCQPTHTRKELKCWRTECAPCPVFF